MPHEYSNFKDKSIPYARVKNRVFTSLFEAESYCTRLGLDVNSAIEYRRDKELKTECQKIAQYQKAILKEVQWRLQGRIAGLRQVIDRDKRALSTCHALEENYYKYKLDTDIAEHTATSEALKIVWDVLVDLQKLTNWHGE
jgi:hypothetical protein